MEFWVGTAGEAWLRLDGKPLSSGRPMLEYGEHVLAFCVWPAGRTSGLLMFAAVYDEEKMRHTMISRRSGQKVYILSGDDGSWKYTIQEPAGDSWMCSGFDDSTWADVICGELPEPGPKDHRRQYRLGKLREFGARGIGVRERADRVWIRKVFTLSRS